MFPEKIEENINRKAEILYEAVDFTTDMDLTMWSWLEKKLEAEHIAFGDASPEDLLEKLDDSSLADLYTHMLQEHSDCPALQL